MRVVVDPKVEKVFTTFPKFVQSRLLKKINLLERFPLINADIKKLGDGVYRMRSGRYRLLFRAKKEKDLIVVYEIDTRGKISYAKG
ncbi:MAG: type II toxin-antitoxin system RelE/ParE family toxin [Candidatus Micrarchaeota archaeon]|nr:type II toxin-antitoxin system RelE/ParE family toxin [Candidatus Micrarchaeota archaeon]MDE1870563.1 type II toxin-antitoxin system RelE/ParE family toxin [Candidatus Micrarchaeota archaeon]